MVPFCFRHSIVNDGPDVFIIGGQNCSSIPLGQPTNKVFYYDAKNLTQDPVHINDLPVAGIN